MEIPRYVIGAVLFGLIWASIAYTQGHITDPVRLIVGVAIFVVFASALSWGLSRLIQYFKDRN